MIHNSRNSPFGQDKGGTGDIADPAGAEGDVLQGTPALFEFGGGTFTQGPDAAQDVLRVRVSA